MTKQFVIPMNTKRMAYGFGCVRVFSFEGPFGSYAMELMLAMR